MKVVWSAYKNNIEKLCLSEVEILILTKGVELWNKINKDDTTILYCDFEHYNYYSQLGILDLWDRIICIDINIPEIDKNVFGAYSKLVVLRNIEAPVLHLDNDFLSFVSLKDIGAFDCDVLSAIKEDTVDYYPVAEKEKDCIGYTLQDGAYNTSVLYFKDETIKNNYCEMSFKYMRNRSKSFDESICDREGGLYMCFAEQQLLHDYCQRNNLVVKTLIKETLITKTGQYDKEQSDNGFIALADASNKCVHLANYKNIYRQDKDSADNFIQQINNTITDLKF